MKPKIVFSNQHFVATFKPAGVLSVPGRVPSEIKVMGRELESHLKVKILPVHRLDREVSGLLIFALNADAHRAANKWFESSWVKKTYQALTEYDPAELPTAQANAGEHEWSCYLVRGKKRAFEAPYGAKSLTLASFKGVVENPEDDSKKALSWLLHPVTGRSHQLRYELSKHHFPVLGDSLYGAKQEYAENVIALRSIAIDFAGCPDAGKYDLPERIELDPKHLAWSFKGMR